MLPRASKQYTISLYPPVCPRACNHLRRYASCLAGGVELSFADAAAASFASTADGYLETEELRLAIERSNSGGDGTSLWMDTEDCRPGQTSSPKAGHTCTHKHTPTVFLPWDADDATARSAPRHVRRSRASDTRPAADGVRTRARVCPASLLPRYRIGALLADGSGVHVLRSGDGHEGVSWHVVFLGTGSRPLLRARQLAYKATPNATEPNGLEVNASSVTVSVEEVEPGGSDLTPIPGRYATAAADEPVVSVRMRQTSTARCSTPDWSGRHSQRLKPNRCSVALVVSPLFPRPPHPTDVPMRGCLFCVVVLATFAWLWVPFLRGCLFCVPAELHVGCFHMPNLNQDYLGYDATGQPVSDLARAYQTFTRGKQLAQMSWLELPPRPEGERMSPESCAALCLAADALTQYVALRNETCRCMQVGWRLALTQLAALSSLALPLPPHLA